MATTSEGHLEALHGGVHLVDMLLRTKCILRKTATRESDGRGGFVVGSPVEVSERCNMRAANSNEQMQAERMEERVEFVVYLRREADIDRGDFVVLNGQEYEVIAIPNKSLPTRRLLEVMVKGYQRGK